ncbi:MAG: cation:proton antiporter [Actinobacteria bacterium]|nr:cation:proton antiporter [Actinomycetota bacterium]
MAADSVLSAGGAVAIVTLLIFGYGVTGRRLGRWNLTAPILFMAAGWVISRIFTATPGEVDGVRLLAEATLAIVLFTDAAGVRPSEIEGERGPISRLLLIALPLTIVFGTFLASLLWPQLPFALALLLGAMLAPTDAALGAATVMNKAVPTRIRRILNVESGLNDGMATPVVLFAIAAAAGAEGVSASESVSSALLEIGIGALVGVVLGFGGGRLVRWSSAATTSSVRGRTVATLMLPICAYAFSGLVDGNGFIAAFVAGTFYAAAWRGDGGKATLELAESVAEPMGDATWLAFGALVVPVLLVGLGWQEVVFALAALTILRMLPVALSLIGVGFQLRTVLFLGWFGPRGLASVVFALIALESLEATAGLDDVLATATLTIIGSVLLHGISAATGARSYGRWVRREQPTAEVVHASEPQARGRLSPINHDN